MKKNLFLVFFFIIIFQNYLFANIDNKIILKVENQIITSYEIKNKILIALILSDSEINQKNINQLKSQAVESLIQLKLKKIELKKFSMEKNDARINGYLNSISSNNITELKFSISMCICISIYISMLSEDSSSSY